MKRPARLGLSILLLLAAVAVGLFAALSGGTEPAAAQTPSALVSNLGQADVDTGTHRSGTLNSDHAQPFTTGGNAGGYTLTSIDWEFARVTNASNLNTGITVTVRRDSTGSRLGEPGAVVGTLTNPAFRNTDTDRVFTFTAAGAGIELLPNRRYWVMLDARRDMPNVQVRNTASDGEDAGGAPGFSIGVYSLYQPYNRTNQPRWVQTGHSKKIRINGDVPNRARLEYDPIAFPGRPIELKVVWDRPLVESVRMVMGVDQCHGFSRLAWCTGGAATDLSDYAGQRIHTFTMNPGETEYTHTFRTVTVEDGERHDERGRVTLGCSDTTAKCTGWIAPIDPTNRRGSKQKHELTTQRHVGSSGIQFWQPLLIDPTRYYNAGVPCTFAPAAYARNSNFSIIRNNKGEPFIIERYASCGEYSYLISEVGQGGERGSHYRGDFVMVLSAPTKDPPTGDESTNDDPTNDEPDEPHVNIIAVTGGMEGAPVIFGINADPPPSADLTVSVTVTASGDYGVTTGARTVTIPATGSAILSIPTVSDGVDEPDGTVTLTIEPGDGYAIGNFGTKTAEVFDDDDAPLTDQTNDGNQASSCATSDTTLLAQVEAKTQDPWSGGRPDLLSMFTRAYNTMLGSDDYTTSDIRARPDKQGAEWQANGPNALWQSIYAELDRLQACREG